MDDNTPVVEFPFNGDYIAVKRPTDAQMMLLAMSRTTDNPARLFRRVLSLLENLVGADAWDEIENGMMTGSVSVESLLQLLADVAKFKWEDLGKPQLAEEDPLPPALENTPPTPAPRIVNRG